MPNPGVLQQRWSLQRGRQPRSSAGSTDPTLGHGKSREKRNSSAVQERCCWQITGARHPLPTGAHPQSLFAQPEPVQEQTPSAESTGEAERSCAGLWLTALSQEHYSAKLISDQADEGCYLSAQH